LKEGTLHSPKVTALCGIWARGVIGSFFFEDAAGKTVTVTGEKYRHMIETFFKPYLNDVNIYYQQDQQDCHIP